jgi:alpha-glucuronidase
MLKVKFLVLIISCFVFTTGITAESGAQLWLRYGNTPNLHDYYAGAIKSVVITEDGAVMNAIRNEMQDALSKHTNEKGGKAARRLSPGALVIGTPASPFVNDPVMLDELKQLNQEGYIIRTMNVRGGPITVIAANSHNGLLYGSFHLIRLLQTGSNIDNLNIKEEPAFNLRILNHWDNLNGTVERGYAGYSIFWNRSEDLSQLKEEYTLYARANASVGINGTVINNVNANPNVLTTEYIERFAWLADIFRPFGIKIYMSINFASPAVIGGLSDSDPLNTDVVKWWETKTKEIYSLIPDFGGFLVKANSEGQPGPHDYDRTHVDGANMLAKILQPYDGIVMWRAFVYEPGQEDRALQAYTEFMPFDGKFEENVIVQVKNGPVDFQPREPFSPLFGAMQKTPVMVEFQITQEYLGFSDHLAYLSTMWKEVLDADTWAMGSGSTVAKTTDGSLFPHKLTAISAVANIGRDINWTGHHFGQANWYAFGRLAWNYNLTSEGIADEWIRMTFSHDPAFIKPVSDIMMRSREAVVDYMTPLGLHHLMGWSHHYGPEPWTDIEDARPDWLPRYYHRASEFGIGFDRSETGSNSVGQYYSPLNKLYNSPTTCPENLLLWFHHLPWDYRLQNGKILWDAIVYKYYAGVEEARHFQREWDRLEGFIDERRFKEVQHKLKIQTREAIWWRDACVLYFQTYSKRPIPAELERPIHDLDEMKKLKFDMLHHN